MARKYIVDHLKDNQEYVFLDDNNWTENVNDNYISCVLKSLKNGKQVHLFIGSDVRITLGNWHSIIVHDLKRDLENGSVSQLTIELIQIMCCLENIFLYSKADNTNIPDIKVINHLILFSTTLKEQQKYANKLEMLTDKKGMIDVLSTTVSSELNEIAEIQQGGGNKKVKILGRERRVYTVRIENGKTIKFVKYMKILVPLKTLKRKEAQKKS